MNTTARQKLAADWGTWASDCEARDTQPASVAADPVVTITATTSTGRTMWTQRVDVFTGQQLSADIIPFRKG